MSTTTVNTNVLAMNAYRSLKSLGSEQSKIMARLASGIRVNSGADDAAGLAISEKMRSQIRGLDVASRNSQDAISLIQTADGGLEQIGNMIQRIRELAIQAGNETNTTNSADSDVAKLAREASQLVIEIDNMAVRTEFNRKNLLTNSSGNAPASTGQNQFYIHVGANAGQSMNVVINHITAGTLGLRNYSTGESAAVSAIYQGGANATAAINQISSALNTVTDERASLGAYQNRLEYVVRSNDIASENLAAAESRIRDTDMAKEMMRLSWINVTQQAATLMLAQANQSHHNVLQLLSAS